MNYILKIDSTEKKITDDTITFSKRTDSFIHRGISVNTSVSFRFTEANHTTKRETLLKDLGVWLDENKGKQLEIQYYSNALKKYITVIKSEITFVENKINTDPVAGLVFELTVYCS